MCALCQKNRIALLFDDEVTFEIYIRVFSTMLHISYRQSCAFIPMSLKVPEMKLSDKVDIKNAQVCCITSSELGDRVSRS